MSKRVSKTKKEVDTTYYEKIEDSQSFVLDDVFTFGIDSRPDNLIFPYMISLSLKNYPEILNELKSLKKKHKVTEKVFYGQDQDVIYLSLMDISEKEKQTLYKQRCFVKAKILFDQVTYKGKKVYMNLKLTSIKKTKDAPKMVASDYESSSESD